jgi:hypothetical protein
MLVFSLVGGLIGGLMSIIRRKELNIRIYPNEGIYSSLRNAVIMGLISCLISQFSLWLVFGSNKDNALISIIVGMVAWFLFGGYIFIEHYLLRIILRIKDFAPLDYIEFLNYAADLIFLRKVGGGYSFIHETMMDFFASLEPDEAEVETKSDG